MPTYEYRCPQGHEFERFQKMTDPPRAKCPVCGRAAIRKISGGAGLIFKGSGFYITDYGKDGKGPSKPTPEGGTGVETGKTESDQPAADASGAAKAKPEKDKPDKDKKSSRKKASS